MNTPYGRDITRQIVKAFRRHGVSVGFYFSPDDFWILYKQGKDVSRRRPEALPTNNPELMAHNKAQIRELLSNYGPIDMLFLDGEPDEFVLSLCYEVARAMEGRSRTAEALEIYSFICKNNVGFRDAFQRLEDLQERLESCQTEAGREHARRETGPAGRDSG